MRNAVIGVLLSAVLLLALVPSALATDRREGTRLTVAAGETVDDDLILSGAAVTIEGTVTGDVIAFAENVAVTGTIEGNLVAMARSVEVRGRVGGTVYTFAEDLLVTGEVGNSVVGFGNRLTIDRGAALGGNWIGFGDSLRSEGRIGRGVLAAARSLRLDGPVSRDVEAWLDQLTVGSNAAIDGAVTYHSEREAIVESGARIGSLKLIPQADRSRWEVRSLPGVGLAIQFTGFLIVGLILLALLPSLRASFPRVVAEKPWQAPLLGLAVLVVVPVVAILLMFTAVGAPLGLLSLLLYPLAIYCGQVLLAWTVGRFVGDRWAWLGGQHWAVIFLAGAFVTTLLTELPIVSYAFSFLAVLYGLGGLLYALTRRNGGQIAA